MNHDHFMIQEEPDFQFCPVCGGRLESAKLKENEPARLVCSDCDFIFYLDPKLVASSVVKLDGRIVLLRRGIQPQKGKWVVPGGYVDRGEAVEAAALRETEEECGIRTRIKNLLGIYSYPGRPVVVVVYVTEYLTVDLTGICRPSCAVWRGTKPWKSNCSGWRKYPGMTWPSQAQRMP